MPAAGQESAAATAQSATSTLPDTELGAKLNGAEPAPKVVADSSKVGSDSQLVPPAADSAAAAQTPSMLMRVLGAIIAGIMFGYALNKGAVYRADVIINQFSFSDNTMLLMFLSATASSILVIASLKSSPWRASVMKGGEKYLKDPTISAFSVLLGGALIGVGMRISGTCPGTIFAQLGSGAVKTWATFAAAILGAFFHGMVRCKILSWLSWGSVKQRTADAITGLGMWPTAIGFIIALVTVLSLVTSFAWEARAGTATVIDFTTAYWHPIAAGVIIGLMQIPLSIFANKNLGASTSLSVLAAHVGGFYKGSSYLNKLREDGTKWLDVLFAAFCILGSTLSAGTVQPDTNFTTEADMALVSWPEVIVGGIVLGFGARFANGCTSGHGITGAGHLSVVSFLGVAAIFGGGIITALCYGDYA